MAGIIDRTYVAEGQPLPPGGRRISRDSRIFSAIAAHLAIDEVFPVRVTADADERTNAQGPERRLVAGKKGVKELRQLIRTG